jgi:hypothetical protein
VRNPRSGAPRFHERITNENGQVIHDLDHPLSEHHGHGSAKFKKSEE